MPPDARPLILFVCQGNTCRSQIAAALAADLVGSEAQVACAGTLPSGSDVHPHAVAVLKERGLAPLVNKSRRIAASDRDHASLIVALDGRVAAELRRQGVKDERLVEWKIQDPYNEPLDLYRDCLRDIEGRIPSLLDRLAAIAGTGAVAAVDSGVPALDYPRLWNEVLERSVLGHLRAGWRPRQRNRRHGRRRTASIHRTTLRAEFE